MMLDMTNSTIRSYSDLRRLQTFEERFEYLKLGGQIGRTTFGFDRYLNQQFYSSYFWKKSRDEVILRDNGCDLGIEGWEVSYGLLIHHMNPISVQDILEGEEWIFDPEFLITTTKLTHNAIHYGTDLVMPKVVIERTPNDTKLW